MKETPLVSIIIASYNRGKFLERTLRSVLNQSYRNLECVVMDGASKDDSVAILTRVAAEDSRLRFISEPDKGEVYATNKGIELSKGEIIAFQASDDYYTPGAVQTSVEFLLKNPHCVGVSGDALYVDAEGQSLNRGKATRRAKMTKETLRDILVYHHVSPWNHGAFFGWKDRMLAHGKLDPKHSVSADYEFYLRMLSEGEEIGFLPRFQVNYTLHPDMGAIKFRGKVNEQMQWIFDRYKLTRYDHFVRLTYGRFFSWYSNPYRSPFIPTLIREIKGDLAAK